MKKLNSRDQLICLAALALTTPITINTHPTAEETLEPNNLLRYYQASFAQYNGNLPEAQQWYQKILESDGSSYAYKGYTKLLFDSGNYATMLELMPKVEKTFKDDADLSFLMAQALEKVGRQDEADKRFIELQQKFKGNAEIAFYTANVYIRRKELDNALQVLDDMLNNSPRKPNNFIFHFMQAQIYMSLQKNAQALDCVQKALELHPRFDKGWLLKAMLEEQEGKLKDAISGYTTYLEITGGSTFGTIERHLLQLTFKQKMAQEKSSTVSIERPCLERALQLFEQKQYAQALEQINGCLSAQPTQPEARLLKIQLLNAMERFDDAVIALQQWIMENPTVDTWFQALHLMAHSPLTINKAVNALTQIEKKHTNNKLVTLYLADLHTRAGNIDAALTYHQKALKLVTDSQILAKIYFQMGLAHFDKQQFDEMKKVLETGYALNANFTPLANLLAYYYASKGNNPTKAQKILNVVLKEDPSNPHYLDTQALIFFQEKQYDKAKNLLEELQKKEPSCATIARHLSKVYHQLGEREKAQTTLKNALQLANDGSEKRKCEHLHACWSSQSS